MKITFLIVAILALETVCAGADWRSSERQAQVTAVVLDEESLEPLKGVYVRGSFCYEIPPSELVRRSGSPNFDHKVTDAEGRVTLSEKTNCGIVLVHVEWCPPGHYHPLKGVRVELTKYDEKAWLPDNVVVTVALQRVKHAIPLYFRRLTDETGGSFGAANELKYDFLLEDWLPPKGTGVVSDVVFTRLPPKACPPKDVPDWRNGGTNYSMMVEFPGEGNGLVEMQYDETRGVKIMEAPMAGYSNRIVRWTNENGHSISEDNFNEDRCFCFRIRTRTDGAGKVVDGYYGKIYNDITFQDGYNPWVPIGSVDMLYYLNPTNGDRNLEFNGKSLSLDPGDIIDEYP